MRVRDRISAYRIQDQIRSVLGPNAPTYNEEMVQQFRDLWANSGAGNSPQIVSKRNNGRGTTKKQKATATVSEPNLFMRLPQLIILYNKQQFLINHVSYLQVGGSPTKKRKPVKMAVTSTNDMFAI